MAIRALTQESGNTRGAARFLFTPCAPPAALPGGLRSASGIIRSSCRFSKDAACVRNCFLRAVDGTYGYLIKRNLLPLKGGPLPRLLQSPPRPRRTLAPAHPRRPRPSLGPARRRRQRKPAVPDDPREIRPLAVQPLVDDPDFPPAGGLFPAQTFSRAVSAPGRPLGTTNAMCRACAMIASRARASVSHAMADVRTTTCVIRVFFRSATLDVVTDKWPTGRVAART